MEVVAPEEVAVRTLEVLFVKGPSPCSTLVQEAAVDGYKRLMAPSMETEILMETKERADKEAIKVFAENLRELLLASPLGRKNIMALDPGFRTGCKVVCLDKQGQMKYHDVVYLHHIESPSSPDAVKITALCQRFEIEAIAIGNGTASRETEAFIRSLELPRSIPVIMVNESGASVYSASDVAREEFPDYDVTVRGAVSIGRGSWTRWPSWSRSIRNPSASANTSTTSISPCSNRASTTSSSVASTASASRSTPPASNCCNTSRARPATGAEHHRVSQRARPLPFA
jgi:uncharacterized protein